MYLLNMNILICMHNFYVSSVMKKTTISAKNVYFLSILFFTKLSLILYFKDKRTIKWKNIKKISKNKGWNFFRTILKTFLHQIY